MGARNSNAAGGQFASASRTGVADARDFIWAQKARGAPVSAVARMLGRNAADVAVIYHAPPLAALVREPAPASPPPPPPPPPPRRCAKSACVRPIPQQALQLLQPMLEAHEVTWAELAGASQARALTVVRQAAYAALAQAGFSQSQIGSYFGGRDHSSVHHGIKMHRLRTAAVSPARAGVAEAA